MAFQSKLCGRIGMMTFEASIVSAVTVVRNASSMVSGCGGLYKAEELEGSQNDLRILNISLRVLSRTKDAYESNLILSATIPLICKALFSTKAEKVVPLLAL